MFYSWMSFSILYLQLEHEVGPVTVAGKSASSHITGKGLSIWGCTTGCIEVCSDLN